MHWCLEKGLHREPLSSRLNPAGLVTATEPWVQLQSLCEPTGEQSRRVERMALTLQNSLPYFFMYAHLSLDYALILSYIIYAPLWIHFHLCLGFIVAGFSNRIQTTSTSVRPSVCLSYEHLFYTRMILSARELNHHAVTITCACLMCSFFQESTKSKDGWWAFKLFSSVMMLFYILCRKALLVYLFNSVKKHVEKS